MALARERRGGTLVWRLSARAAYSTRPRIGLVAQLAGDPARLPHRLGPAGEGAAPEHDVRGHLRRRAPRGVSDHWLRPATRSNAIRDDLAAEPERLLRRPRPSGFIASGDQRI